MIKRQNVESYKQFNILDLLSQQKRASGKIPQRVSSEAVDKYMKDSKLFKFKKTAFLRKQYLEQLYHILTCFIPTRLSKTSTFFYSVIAKT